MQAIRLGSRALRLPTTPLLRRKLSLSPPHRHGGRRSLSTEAAAAVTSSAAASSSTAGFGPVSLAVEGLAAVQLSTGLPWWAAISGGAVALRVALLPALWYQLRETRRFVALRPRFAVLRAEAASIKDPAARANAFLRSVWRTARAEGVQPLAVVGMPLVQIPLLLLAVIAVRRLMMDSASPHAAALERGGTAWFTDLTKPDANKVLPIVAVTLVVANMQLAFQASRSPLWSFLRDAVQGLSVVAFPFYAELPAGVFMYWLPNSLWSLAQSVAVRRTNASLSLRGLTPASLASASRVPSPQTAPTVPATPAVAAAAPVVPAVVSSASVAPISPAAPAASAAPAAPAAPPAAPPAPETDAEVVSLRESIAKAEASGDLEPWVVAHVQLSKRLMGSSRVADAVTHLWPAVQAAPREASGPLRFQLALALALQEQHAAAEPLLRQVLELEPSFTKASLALVSVLHAQGKTAPALELVEEIAAANPESPDLAEWCEQQAKALRGVLSS